MAIVSNRKLRTNSTDWVSGYNGTDTSITYVAEWPIVWAASYNATTDLITVANNAVFNITTWSVSALIRTSAATYVYIMCKNGNTWPTDNFYVWMWLNASNGKVSFYNGAWRNGNAVVNDGKDHLVTLWAAPWSTDIFIDGVLDATLAYNMFIATWTASLYIGNRYMDNRNFAGNISNAYFYNHKIIASEEKNRYLFIKWFM